MTPVKAGIWSVKRRLSRAASQRPIHWYCSCGDSCTGALAGDGAAAAVAESAAWAGNALHRANGQETQANTASKCLKERINFFGVVGDPGFPV